MKQLTAERFGKAAAFLKTEGRPLDRRRFEHHFEAGPAEAVLTELARFQNSDGGFGRALEPDLRTPASSAVVTTVALQVLREVNARASHPLVQGAIRYLLATYDPNTGTWRIVPPAVNDAPHAPWWHDEGQALKEAFRGFLLNPRAEILGNFYHYPPGVPADLLAGLTAAVLARLGVLDGDLSMDEVHCCLELLHARGVPGAVRERARAAVYAAGPRLVSRDPATWGGYVATPLSFAPTPASPVAAALADILDRNLDYEIDRQDDDGSWSPNWSWGDAYPDAWDEAEREWRGRLTLQTLLSLRAYGRVEGAGVQT